LLNVLEEREIRRCFQAVSHSSPAWIPQHLGDPHRLRVPFPVQKGESAMSLKHVPYCLLFLAATCGSSNAAPQVQDHAQATSQTAGQKARKQGAAKHNSVHQDEGDRVFQQNCSRCHAAPEGFSPRISGTVVRHMRVRASLSQHDEQELLRFLNP
jgi:cytochrome c5